jgi:hypothetical protein
MTGDIDKPVIPNGINQIEWGFMCDNPDSIKNLMLGCTYTSDGYG